MSPAASGRAPRPSTPSPASPSSFPRGEFTAVMGPSGSGKSTLMHVLAGLDAPTSGSVLIDDVELSGLDDARLTQLRRDKIGFIFQAFNLLPVLTARGEHRAAAVDRRPQGRRRSGSSACSTPSASTDRRTHRPSELSGGQQQRVAVARALVTQPAVVFADEPTGNLDSHSSADVLDLLRRAVDEFGQTVVMVTHDPTAADVTDRIVELADGRSCPTERDEAGRGMTAPDPPQPRVAQAAHRADRDGDRPRRRDDQRHLHPHRHDRPRRSATSSARPREKIDVSVTPHARSTARTPTRTPPLDAALLPRVRALAGRRRGARAASSVRSRCSTARASRCRPAACRRSPPRSPTTASSPSRRPRAGSRRRRRGRGRQGHRREARLRGRRQVDRRRRPGHAPLPPRRHHAASAPSTRSPARPSSR